MLQRDLVRTRIDAPDFGVDLGQMVCGECSAGDQGDGKQCSDFDLHVGCSVFGVMQRVRQCAAPAR
jgi:hypothetical protein